jgi:hypothetical protein
VLDDEGWVQALSFEEAANKLVNQSCCASWAATVNMMLFTLLIKEFSCFFAFNIFWDWFTKLFFEFFHHADPSPWGSEIDFKYLLRFS